jgi:hypothetical protein
VADQFNILDQSSMYLATQQLESGEETVPRHFGGATSTTMTSQTLRLAYFTARKSELISNVRIFSAGTAAGATPSLIRVGIWTADLDGALLALVGSTASDTALLAGTFTAYTKALSASFTKVAGQRYAAGLLVVTAAAAPTIPTLGANIAGTEAKIRPVISGQVTAQADLPSTLVAGSVGYSMNSPYLVLVP